MSPLPNDNMDFTAFDVLPAASLDDIVENIESLQEGTSFDTTTNTSTFGGAWATWAPTWINLTVGNGTLNYAKYKQIGKTVHFRISFTLGSTSSVAGLFLITPPVPVNADIAAVDPLEGSVTFLDNNGEIYTGFLAYNVANSSLALYVNNASGTYLFQRATASNIPMIWATGDKIMAAGCYETT